MAYLHLQGGGAVPTAGIIGQKYTHIVAETYEDLASYIPEKDYEALEAECVADSATYKYISGAWAVSSIANMSTYFASHPDRKVTSVLPTDLMQVERGGVTVGFLAGSSTPIVATYGDLPVIANDGQECLVPKLVGTGYFRCRYVGATSRWVVCAGECIVNIKSPFVGSPATDTNLISTPICTIPAGLLGVDDIWEYVYPSSTQTIVSGSDKVSLIIGSAEAGSSLANASGIRMPNMTRLLHTNATTVFRVLQTSMVGFTNTGFTGTVDVSSSILISVGVTPGAINNITSVSHFSVKKIS